jgi:hypothetical protein
MSVSARSLTLRVDRFFARVVLPSAAEIGYPSRRTPFKATALANSFFPNEISKRPLFGCPYVALKISRKPHSGVS